MILHTKVQPNCGQIKNKLKITAVLNTVEKLFDSKKHNANFCLLNLQFFYLYASNIFSFS